jgi:hypothetical protein
MSASLPARKQYNVQPNRVVPSLLQVSPTYTLVQSMCQQDLNGKVLPCLLQSLRALLTAQGTVKLPHGTLQAFYEQVIQRHSTHLCLVACNSALHVLLL